MDIVKERRVILRPIEDGWWLAEVPSLPGCLSQGSTKDEALENVRDAIQGYIAVLEEDGLPIPQDDYRQAELTVA
jgi:predicted RNase H-like HicB family nuclease